jgi:hypothetical protein
LQHTEQGFVADPAWEVHVFVQLMALHIRHDVAIRWAGARDEELHVLPLSPSDYMICGLDQQIEALLLADDANIRHKVSPPPFPSRVNNAGAHAVEIGSRPDREYPTGAHSAAFDCNAAVGLIGSERYICGSESEPFEQHQTAPKKAPAAEFRLEQLGIEIVMVEDEFLSEKQLIKTCDQEDQVWRIATMNDIEPVLAKHTDRIRELPKQRACVFRKVRHRSLCLHRQRMSIDVDTFK